MDVPYVVLSEPKNSMDNVPLNTSIRVWFNQDLSESSVSEATVFLLDLISRKIVLGNISYKNKILLFDPCENLSPSTKYQFTILGGERGVKNILSVLMPRDYKLEFTTMAGSPLPIPQIVYPVDRTIIQNPVYIKWEDGQAPFDVQVALDAGFDKVFWPLNGEGMAITNDSQVIPDTIFPDGFYYVRVRNHGQAWAEYNGFAVSAKEDEPVVGIDELTLVSASPGAFAVNVDTNEISLTFNRPIGIKDNIYVIKYPF